MGEKRFDNISDLVHDGLISFYIEKHASNYIAEMSEENNYSESPYVSEHHNFEWKIEKKKNSFSHHNSLLKI